MNWRKGTALLLAALLALGLTACQKEKTISGTLTEIQMDEDGNLTAFVLKPAGAKQRYGVKMAEDTRAWPAGGGHWSSPEAMMEAFLEDFQIDCQVSAWCRPGREKLETEDGEHIPAYWALTVDITGVLEREALTLRDGTAVDVMRGGAGWRYRTYQLQDGTELLYVDNGLGPENHYVAGRESFDDLSETAKEKVRAYYEERGLLFDEREELEKSYAAWRELGADFVCDHIGQDVVPAASNERVMYFLTTVMLAEENGRRVVTNLDLCDAFDRETGERIETPDLFGVPWEEVCRRLPELSGWEIDPAVAAEMTEALALTPEWICFDQDGLNIMFPAESVPSNLLDQEGPPEEWGEPQAVGHSLGIEWGDMPDGFVQPWAIPKSAGQ